MTRHASQPIASPYPSTRRQRDAFVLAHRSRRPTLDPWRHQGVIVEPERAADGGVVTTATVFLTGRECPWRCVMCDLWQHTIVDDTPRGAIPAQIMEALETLRGGLAGAGLPPSPSGYGGQVVGRAMSGALPAGQVVHGASATAGHESAPHAAAGLVPRAAPRAPDKSGAYAWRRANGELPAVLKLYNAGSFFDDRAVPPADDDAIVAALSGVRDVVVESHPALVRDRTWRMNDALGRHGVQLEVAMGLETVHAGALNALNKGATADAFAHVARQLATHGIRLRVFVLIHPPFVPGAEQLAWLERSVDFAFDCGASVVSLIPTRSTTGAMTALAAEGSFTAPRLLDVEAAALAGLSRARGRVFVDLWDLAQVATCRACAAPRRDRLHRLNLEQHAPPALTCSVCGEVTAS